jgi:LysR family glycine cleavage system transcriptional activator
MDDWRLWLRGAGIQGIDPTRGLKFDSVPLALQAAISGAGVAIGRGELIAEDLATGRLVEPFRFELPSECAYYFVAPELTWEQPKIAAFRSWLFAEVEVGQTEPDRTPGPGGAAAVGPAPPPPAPPD